MIMTKDRKARRVEFDVYNGMKRDKAGHSDNDDGQQRVVGFEDNFEDDGTSGI
jgi:hypothetical protein